MKMKKVLMMVLAAAMAVGLLAGCGGNSGKDGEAKGGAQGEKKEDGLYVYEMNVENKDEVESPAYTFGGSGMFVKMMRALRVELKLADDNTFTMDVHGWMQEDTEGSDRAVGEAFEFGDGMYAEFFSGASGTYEKDGDVITITATKATQKIPDLGVSYIAQIFAGGNAGNGSYNPEGDPYYGEWSSEDVPDVLKQFPVTEFKVKGNEIVSWERGDILTTAKGEKAEIIFYADKTAYYRDTENGLDATVDWKLEGTDVVLMQDDAVSGEITYIGNESTPIEVTVRKYTDRENWNDFSQSVALTAENMSALQ